MNARMTGWPSAAVLPSAEARERMGFARATAGLSAPQATYMQMVLAYHWQPGAPGLRACTAIAGQEYRRVMGCDPGMSPRQVARRFARLDQSMLRSMRA